MTQAEFDEFVREAQKAGRPIRAVHVTRPKAVAVPVPVPQGRWEKALSYFRNQTDAEHQAFVYGMYTMTVIQISGWLLFTATHGGLF